ncbi:hypothetical protein BEWA_024980 [Theileria equi strain WA]|uniref:Uncharacterized protein n=1 Tax=Theileria equi strain WA TaxID=1537102 RepID=L0AXL4_THEEQ|nr:hypothetical protein BEWA_024980 [Theileria equi strain WA]AFZ79649.1 hypothetical protein BEWA_024980 [Theileria equi strain WA]|eukprot:XP_004829315.1 hypothetical protein BEWA_024980 [Theileria equi strain WA]
MFVQCVKGHSQKRIQDSLDLVKASDLDNLSANVETLMDVLAKVEHISFINLGDVFGSVMCQSVFDTVHQCCVKNFIAAAKMRGVNTGLNVSKTRKCEETIIHGEMERLKTFLEMQEKDICVVQTAF